MVRRRMMEPWSGEVLPGFIMIRGIDINEAGGKYYISQFESNLLIKNISDNVTTESFNYGSYAVGFCNEDDVYFLVLSGNSILTKYRISDNLLVGTAPLQPGNATDIEIDKPNNRYFIINRINSRVDIYNYTTDAFITSYPTTGRSYKFAFDYSNDRYYVCGAGLDVRRISDGSLIVNKGITGEPFSVAINNNTNEIMVSNFTNKIYIYDKSTNNFLRYKNTLAVTQVLNYHSATNKIYCGQNNQITIVNY